MCFKSLEIVPPRLIMISANYLEKLLVNSEHMSPGMWDSVITFSKAYPECWVQGNSLIPKLLSFVRKGSNENLAVSYPCILPLCSLLPSEVLFMRL